MKHAEQAPETPATTFLRRHGVAHSNHLYEYEDHGGTRVSARELNVPEHHVVKTLIFEDEAAKPLIVLMHGDRKVSAKELARQVGVAADRREQHAEERPGEDDERAPPPEGIDAPVIHFHYVTKL